MKNHIKILSLALTLLLSMVLLQKTLAQTTTPTPAGGRERLLMDANWRFAFGHATDPARDFDPFPDGTTFSYFAKAGTAAGARRRSSMITAGAC